VSKRQWFAVAAVSALSVALVAPASYSQSGEPTCQGKKATIVTPPGGFVVNGTDKADVIVGTSGNDFIRGNGGNDVICGGDGNDSLFGAGGKDRPYGEGGDDKLFGGAAKDTLVGGPGADTCKEARTTKKC
jgi:hypothetical protein